MRCEIQQSLADVIAEWTQANARKRSGSLNCVYEGVDPDRPSKVLLASLGLWGDCFLFYRSEKIAFKAQLKTRIEIVSLQSLSEVMNSYLRSETSVAVVCPSTLDALSIDVTPRKNGLVDLHLILSGNYEKLAEHLLRELPCKDKFVR